MSVLVEPASTKRREGAKSTVGVGIPGAISPATGLIKNANSTWLNGRRSPRISSRALGRPVRLANDANCFALSEATDGAAAGAAVVFGVIIGTGTGGGLVVNGRLVVGANAIAGEWGHNPLPSPEDDERPGPPCYCGRSGCIETFLSGPALARDYIALGGDDLSRRGYGGARRAAATPRAIGLPRSLRAAIRARPRLDHQRRRSRRDRARRRPSNISRLYANIPLALGAACVFRSRRHAARPREARRRQRRARRRLAVGRVHLLHSVPEATVLYLRPVPLQLICVAACRTTRLQSEARLQLATILA